jgi:hypothetical protein
MNRITLVFAAVVFLSLARGVAQANLLMNPGFESGTGPTNWSNIWGNFNPENWNTPPEGTMAGYFKGGWAGTGTNQGIIQATSLGSITAGYEYVLSGSFYNDNGWASISQGIKLEFFDASSIFLGSITNTLTSIPDLAWTSVAITGVAPANVSYAQVVFEVNGAGPGGVLGGDNLDLYNTAIPEPTTAALVGFMGLGVLALRRFKR